MSLTPGQTASVIVDANKTSAKTATGIIAGNIINERLAKAVIPKLPLMARGYLDTPMGHAALANIAAGAMIHFFPGNKRAMQASSAMIEAAMVTFASSFNIEELANEILDGVTLPSVDVAPIKNKFTQGLGGNEQD